MLQEAVDKSVFWNLKQLGYKSRATFCSEEGQQHNPNHDSS